jgi:hypothetical protein
VSPSLRGKVGALARGEVSTAELAAYGAANGDAYDLLDTLPPEGPARLAAWCAFVVQTHADNLIASGQRQGFCERGALDEASMLYQFAGGWLDRARTASTSGGYRLDVVVPQPYFRFTGPQGAPQVSALRRTAETVQSRLGADLAERSAQPIYERLAPAMRGLQAALDSAAGAGVGKPSPELLATIAQTLQIAVDRAYQAGQLLAMPHLIAARPDPVPEPPARIGSAALRMFLPGDPGFDRWCLTDPMVRGAGQYGPAAIRKLDALWASDPEPAKTLALQADIAAALEKGVADFTPRTTEPLSELSMTCPWPGVMLALAPLVIGDERIAAGERFALSVGTQNGGFRREIVRIAPREDD